VAVCDCCGKYYTFGALKVGRYAFCSGVCSDRGQVLTVLDKLSPAQIEIHVMNAHRAGCPTCAGGGPLDLRRSYWVWSFIVFTRWSTDQRIECIRCSRARQMKALVLSVFAGWWGVPFGLFLTPTQIVRNLVALVLPREVPSPDFRRAMLFDLAYRMTGDYEEDTAIATANPAIVINS
jgi:hypothetical protein